MYIKYSVGHVNQTRGIWSASEDMHLHRLVQVCVTTLTRLIASARHRHKSRIRRIKQSSRTYINEFAKPNSSPIDGARDNT